MGGYGYTYQSYSTYKYNTDESFEPDKRRPFVPSVPNSIHNSEGYVTRKTIVPVASRPHGDEYRHGSPTKAYPVRDDAERHRQKSPVHGRLQNVDEFLTKVQNEASRPARFATTDWRRSPQSTGYDGANDNGDYDNYRNKEGYRPICSSIPNDNYLGNGYFNHKGKEGHKPVGSSIGNDNYHRYQPAENYSPPSGWSRPNISSGWTAPPRNGTQLSKPTNNIGKTIGLLKEAAKLTFSGHGGRQKDDGYYNYQRSQLREPSIIDQAMQLAKEAERLKNVLMAPPQSRPSVPVEPTAPNRDEYRETIDRRDAQRRYGNLNLASLPTSTIDSREAEKKYNGSDY